MPQQPTPGAYRLEIVPIYETQYRTLEVHSFLDAATVRAAHLNKVAGNRTRVVDNTTGAVIYTTEVSYAHS